MAKSKAYENGYSDGLDWDLSGFQSREQLERAETGWDEATLNAVGSTGQKHPFGVDLYDADEDLTDEARAALAEYNRGAHAGALQQWDNTH